MIKKSKKRITISIDTRLAEEIEKKAKYYETTKSDLIELWLDWYLFRYFLNWHLIRNENIKDYKNLFKGEKNDKQK